VFGLALSGLLAFLFATPAVPSLGYAGPIAFLVDSSCSGGTADYHLDLDRTKVTSSEGVLDLTILTNCEAAHDVRWALLLGGAIANGTKVTVTNVDPHQYDRPRDLQVRPLDDWLDETNQLLFLDLQGNLSIPAAGAAGIDQAESQTGELRLVFSITNAKLGQHSGARTALAAPSMETELQDIEEKGLRLPGDWFVPNGVQPASKEVVVGEALASTVTVTAGGLTTDQRAELASPALKDPGVLRWQGPHLAVSALVVDTNAERGEQFLLFLAGILVGLATSISIWVLELWLSARGVLPD
jgi:hypothetical protein